MAAAFERTFHVRWGDMDYNAHMRNTAYLDTAADIRMMYFAENGFPMGEFERLRLGPVILRDELEYFRELRLLERIRVSLIVAALSPDASRFVLRNEFRRLDDDAVATRLTSTGGWLDQTERRIVPPPPALAALLRTMPRSEDFRELVPGRK
jgi:acyl-CoA thioester hydrolase